MNRPEDRPPGIELRPAHPDDAARVARVLLASRQAFLPYAVSPHSDEDTRRWVRDVLVPSGGVTVALDGEAMVGVLAVSRDAGVSWIDQLYLSPAFVGRGLGTRLLRHALQRLEPPVRLYTFQANAGARRFYERHGFRAIAFSDGSGNDERCPDVLYELCDRLA
jgi:GNAT superfamily N-acetyltransferase